MKNKSHILITGLTAVTFQFAHVGLETRFETGANLDDWEEAQVELLIDEPETLKMRVSPLPANH